MNRTKLVSLVRFGVCLLLLAAIFHIIFCNEVQLQLNAGNGTDWNQLPKWEQRRLAWTRGPAGLWESVRRLPASALLLSFASCGVLIALGGLRWREVLRAQGIPLPLFRVLRISLVAHFFNAFLLGTAGGDVLKAWYAARAAPQRGPEAAFSVFVDRLIGTFATVLFTAALALLNLQLILTYKRHLATALLIVAMMVASGLLVFLGFFTDLLRHDGPVARLVRRLPRGESFVVALAGCRSLARHPGFLGRQVLLSVLLNVALVGVIAALAPGLGVNLPGAAVWYLVPAILSVAALPVTPAGLGVRENLFVWLLTVPMLDIKPGAALSLSLVGYSVNLSWSVIGGVVYLLTPGRREEAKAVTQPSPETAA